MKEYVREDVELVEVRLRRAGAGECGEWVMVQ